MWRPRERLDRGAAAVEMALVLPVLLLLLFGLIDFGRLLFAKVELSSAAREGARIVAINRGTQAAVDQAVQQRVDAAQSFGPHEVNVSVPDHCPSVPTPTAAATVTLTYSFQWVTPLGAVANLVAPASPTSLRSGGDTTLLTQTGTMRCAG